MARKYINSYVGEDGSARGEFEQLTHAITDLGQSVTDLEATALTHLQLDGVNSPMTGAVLTQNVIPNVDETYDSGSSAKRWNRTHNVAGTFMGGGGTINLYNNTYTSGILAGYACATGTATVVHGNTSGAFYTYLSPGLTVGNCFNWYAGNVASIVNRASGAHMLMSVYNYGSTSKGYVTNEGGSASGFGSLTGGYLFLRNGHVINMTNNGRGSFLWSYISTGAGSNTHTILHNSAAKGSFTCVTGHGRGPHWVSSTNSGTFIQGYVSGRPSTGGSAYNYLKASGRGAFVQGFVTTGGQITTSGWGAFGQGYTIAGGGILASGKGAFCQGYAGNQADIKASGLGSTSLGAVKTIGYDLIAAGVGALAVGYADTAAIYANAANAAQFFPGTNTQANSIQVGDISTEGVMVKGSGGVIVAGTTSIIDSGTADNVVLAVHDLAAESASHDGATSTTVLADSSKAWTTNFFAKAFVENTSDGDSSGVCATNTLNTLTLTAPLSGGTNDDFGATDVVTIESGILLTDSGEAWTPSDFIGEELYNITDSCVGTVTANTGTEIECSAGMSGGTRNAFRVGDSCSIIEALLTDATKSWIDDEWIGAIIGNTTQGSSGTITDNDATTITVTLTGGSDHNAWADGDTYEIYSSDPTITGKGALVVAAMDGAADVDISGRGSSAIGQTGFGTSQAVDMKVTVDNAWQFSPGTNDEAGTLKVGAAPDSAGVAARAKDAAHPGAIMASTGWFYAPDDGGMRFGDGNRANAIGAAAGWYDAEMYYNDGTGLTIDPNAGANSAGTEPLTVLGPVDAEAHIVLVARTSAATYTATTETVVLCDTNSNNVVVTLPAISATIEGRVYHVRHNVVGNALTIDGTGSDTVNGNSSPEAVGDNQSLMLVADNTAKDWVVV